MGTYFKQTSMKKYCRRMQMMWHCRDKVDIYNIIMFAVAFLRLIVLMMRRTNLTTHSN